MFTNKIKTDRLLGAAVPSLLPLCGPLPAILAPDARARSAPAQFAPAPPVHAVAFPLLAFDVLFGAPPFLQFFTVLCIYYTYERIVALSAIFFRKIYVAVPR